MASIEQLQNALNNLLSGEGIPLGITVEMVIQSMYGSTLNDESIPEDVRDSLKSQITSAARSRIEKKINDLEVAFKSVTDSILALGISAPAVAASGALNPATAVMGGQGLVAGSKNIMKALKDVLDIAVDLKLELPDTIIYTCEAFGVVKSLFSSFPTEFPPPTEE